MKLLYAQVREDPEIDRKALSITATDRVLTITSGGCTALTLLADGPAEIVSADLNPAQNHLLELKLAAIRQLDLLNCRRFMGARPIRGEARRGRSGGRLAWYDKLRSLLSPAACDFWDGRPSSINRGLLYAGSTERMVRWMPRLLFGLVHRSHMARKWLRCRSIIEQARFYREEWDTPVWRRALSFAFRPLFFQRALGAAFFERFGKDDFSAAWARKVEKAFTEVPTRSNYFLSQILLSRYLPGEAGLPPYLRAGVFERVRDRAERIRSITGDFVDALRRFPPGHFHKMSLSNAFEWLPQDRVRSAFEAAAAGLCPGGRIVLRHLMAETSLPDGVGLRERKEESDALTRAERTCLYERVSVYERY